MHVKVAIGALLLLLCAPGFAIAEEHLIDGKTVRETFERPEVAALATAACVGDVAGVHRLKASGANPNAIGYAGISPLMWAYTCSNLAGMRALLEEGADANHEIQVGDESYSLVFQAANDTDSAYLALLLSFGGNPNARRGEHTALEQGMLHAINTEDLDRLDEEQPGPWANYYALIRAGADVNAPNVTSIGITACSLYRFRKVAELIELGYRIDLSLCLSILDAVDTTRLSAVRRDEYDSLKAKLIAMGVKPLPPFVDAPVAP